MNMDQSHNGCNSSVAAVLGGQLLTMSSREIADLCEKRHDNGKRTIETLAERGVISSPQIEEKATAGRPVGIYHLVKRDTLVIVAQLSPEFTARVVDRWQRLEGQSAAARLTGPQLLAAALIEANDVMQAQATQIEVMQEDADAHHRLMDAGGSVTITAAAKTIGMRPKDLFEWLSNNGWIYRRPGSATWLGYQSKCNLGLVEHRAAIIHRADGSERITEQIRVTAKGLAALSKVIFPTVKLIEGDA